MGEGQRRLADLGMDTTIDRVETWQDTTNPGAMRSWARANAGEAGDYAAALRNKAGIAQANAGVEGAAMRTAAAGYTPGGSAGPAPSQGPAGLPPPDRGPMFSGGGMAPAAAQGGERYSDLWRNKPEGMTLTNADIQQGIDSERGLPVGQRGYGPTVGVGPQDVAPKFDMMDIISGKVKYADLKRNRDALKAYTMSTEPADQFDSPMQEAALAGVTEYDRLLEAARRADEARQTEAFPRAAMIGEREADRASREKIAGIEASRPRVGASRSDDPTNRLKALEGILKLTQDDEGNARPGSEKIRQGIFAQVDAVLNQGAGGGMGGGVTPGFPGYVQPPHPDREAAIQLGIANGRTRQEIEQILAERGF
jgi:hypothetical protein